MSENSRSRNLLFSKKQKAGKRRTYFFDVRATKSQDLYLILTESTKKQGSDNYLRNQIFLYKEDFADFSSNLELAIAYIMDNLNITDKSETEKKELLIDTPSEIDSENNEESEDFDSSWD